MKIFKLSTGLFFLISFVFIENSNAQHRMIQRRIQNKIERDMIEKHVEPQRERGRESIKESTYEDKSSIVDLKYRSEGTIVYQQKTFNKKGKVDQNITSKYELSVKGELITISTDNKQAQQILFIYDDNAHYVLDQKNKTAVKMPLRHLNRMIVKRVEHKIDESSSTWTNTGRTETINGYKCTIYEQIDEDGSKGVFWIAGNVYKKPLYINSVQFMTFDAKAVEKNNLFPNNAAMIKTELFDKSGSKIMEFEMTEYSPNVNQKVFDLTGYEVKDIIDGF